MHNSQFLCFLTEEMRYQDLVMRKASMVRSSFCSAPSRNWSVSALRASMMSRTVFAKYLWIQLASAMTMVEIGKNYWEDYIYKHKGLQYIEKGFDMVSPPEE